MPVPRRRAAGTWLESRRGARPPRRAQGRQAMLESAVIPNPSTVRREVLGQHEAVRDLLEQALVQAAARLRPKPAASTELRHLAYEIRHRVRAHLSFEERLLIPVLSSADTWGPERARNLLEE